MIEYTETVLEEFDAFRFKAVKDEIMKNIFFDYILNNSFILISNKSFKYLFPKFYFFEYPYINVLLKCNLILIMEIELKKLYIPFYEWLNNILLKLNLLSSYKRFIVRFEFENLFRYLIKFIAAHINIEMRKNIINISKKEIQNMFEISEIPLYDVSLLSLANVFIKNLTILNPTINEKLKINNEDHPLFNDLQYYLSQFNSNLENEELQVNIHLNQIKSVYSKIIEETSIIINRENIGSYLITILDNKIQKHNEIQI